VLYAKIEFARAPPGIAGNGSWKGSPEHVDLCQEPCSQHPKEFGPGKILQPGILPAAIKVREIAGLKCADWCVGPTGVDTMHLRYWQRSPSFVEIHATYTSSRYGGLLVWWHTYTSDVAHWRDIDDEVWKLVAQWNLLDNAESATGQHGHHARIVATRNAPPKSS
jgi:hypothetical protein